MNNIQNLKNKLLKKDNLIVIFLVGILLLVISIPTNHSNNTSNLFPQQEQNIEVEEKKTDQDIDILEEYTNELEHKFEKILSLVHGIGDVKVMITLASTEEIVVEKEKTLRQENMTEEDHQGGNRITKNAESDETTVYYTDSDGTKNPYIVKTLMPRVEGVLVVAQGGNDAKIKEDVIETLQALFHVEAHKIKVVGMDTIK